MELVHGDFRHHMQVEWNFTAIPENMGNQKMEIQFFSVAKS